jgi:hypothetical protein
MFFIFEFFTPAIGFSSSSVNKMCSRKSFNSLNFLKSLFFLTEAPALRIASLALNGVCQNAATTATICSYTFKFYSRGIYKVIKSLKNAFLCYSMGFKLLEPRF